MTAPSIESITLPDGYCAAVRWWRAEPAIGAVLYLHGIQSHGGWYERSGARLAREGFTVLMPDRRGSGLNPQRRGHAESDAQCLQDAATFLNAVLDAAGFPSAHLVGVSWGGKLAAALASAVPQKVASLSLVAPGIYPRVDLAVAEKFRVGIALINDRNRLFDIPLNDPRLFTANPARIKYVEEDPLKLTQVTARFLLASRRLDRKAYRLATSAWSGPVHLMLAGHDPIIDNQRTRDWFLGLHKDRHTLTEYPMAYHTIEFEPDPSAFLDDLAGWIMERNTPPLSSVSRAR
jgi:alpha-beta hydrolase superfamily lysophospholipase